MKLGEEFERAFDLALELHGEDERKGSKVPYMGHLLGVTAIVIDDGGSESEIIAALLHDGPEDHDGRETLRRIRQEFGDEVADIVEALSDTFEKEKPEWKQRKTDYFQSLRNKPDNELTKKVLRVSIADKLYNARAVSFDFGREGDEVWSRFNAPKDDQLWYYRSLGEIYSEKLGSDNPLVKAYLKAEADLKQL